MKSPMFPILAAPEEAAIIAEEISVYGAPLLEKTYQMGTAYSDRVFGDQSYGILRRTCGLEAVFVLGYVSGVRAAKAKQRQKGGSTLVQHTDTGKDGEGACLPV